MVVAVLVVVMTLLVKVVTNRNPPVAQSTATTGESMVVMVGVSFSLVLSVRSFVASVSTDGDVFRVAFETPNANLPTQRSLFLCMTSIRLRDYLIFILS